MYVCFFYMTHATLNKKNRRQKPHVNKTGKLTNEYKTTKHIFPRKTNEKLFLYIFILIKWHTLFMLVCFVFLFLFGINIFAKTHVESERAFLKNTFFKVKKVWLEGNKSNITHVLHHSIFVGSFLFLLKVTNYILQYRSI